jgi:hypothetical protein
MKTDTKSYRLFTVIFYASYMAFAIFHLILLIALLGHFMTLDFLSFFGLMLGYPSFVFGNEGALYVFLIWTYPLMIAVQYVQEGRIIKLPWNR